MCQTQDRGDGGRHAGRPRLESEQPLKRFQLDSSLPSPAAQPRLCVMELPHTHTAMSNCGSLNASTGFVFASNDPTFCSGRKNTHREYWWKPVDDGPGPRSAADGGKHSDLSAKQTSPDHIRVSLHLYVYMTDHRLRLNRKQKSPLQVHPKVGRIYSKLAAGYLCITAPV